MQPYPLLFYPKYFYRIWGRDDWDRLNRKNVEKKTGESWEISTVPSHESVIRNGEFSGKLFSDIVVDFPMEILGSKVIKKYGSTFPLLIKFISTAEPLSIQVHPDDAYAQKHHHSFGKTEMWYIINANDCSRITIGFKPNVDKTIYLEHLKNGTLESILQQVPTQKGDVFYLPAGRVHAIGKDIILAEIQQNSDTTYRIYDYNRVDSYGNLRELHTDRALDVMDFSYIENPKEAYKKDQQVSNLVNSNYFITQKIQFKKKFNLTSNGESFSILINLSQKIELKWSEHFLKIEPYTTVFIPASLLNLELNCDLEADSLWITI